MPVLNSRPSLPSSPRLHRNGIRPVPLVLILLAMLAAGIHPASALTIIPQFDSSITSDPNAATMEATINEVIRTYETMLSDPFTIDVTFVASSSVGLGENISSYQSDTYSDFLSKLTADQTTTSDAIALSHLPVQSTNPVNGSSSMEMTVANAKALGIFTYGAAAGTVYLNTSEMNLSRSGTQNASKYDMFSVTEHELDEVLGISSSLINGSNGQPAPTGAINPIDLFRYDQSGNRSYTTSSNALSYLSIDGTTDLAQFNQISNSTNSGDFGDYNSYSGTFTPQVQNAYGTPGVILNLGVPEKTSLDVIGYNLLTPFTWDATATSGSNPLDGAGTWSNGATGNWSNGASDLPWTNSSTAIAQFGGTSFISGTSYNVTLGTNIVVGTLTFANQAYTLSSSSNSLTINKGIISVANATISAPTILSGDNGWDTVGNAVLTVNGNISGASSLAKQGPGSLYLTGSDSYAGGTSVQEGTLFVGGSYALPIGGNVTVSGGALDLHGNNVSIGNLNFGDGVSTIAASFQDSGVTRGAASLAGNITYNGTLVNGGSYFPAATLSANLSLLSGTHSISTPDGYLASNYDLVISGTLSGPGGIAKNSGNYIALAAANTYTGPTIVNSGWLFLAATNAIPSMSDVTVNSGGVLSLNPANAQSGVTTGNYDQSVGSLSGNGQINLGSATLTFGNDNASTTFSGYIGGTGGLTKTGTGAFIIPVGFAYTGPTTINSGVVELSNGGSVAGIITGSSGAFLAAVGNAQPVLASTITGGIALQQQQTNFLFVTGDNTYSGGTYITGYALVLGNNTATGSLGTGNVYNTAGLYLYHSNNFTLPNAISGTGFIFQQGSGTATLTGSNSYTGSTQIYSGSIQLGNGGTTGSLSSSSSVSGNSGTTLIFDHSDNITFANPISSYVGLSQIGAGAVTITANNGYVGPTTVTSGTLIVNGGITGSTTTVNSGGAVGGIGTFGPLAIQSGGIVRPGAGAGGVGLLTTGNFSLATGATLLLQLDGTSGGGTAGTQYDQLSVDGSVTLGGNIQISLSNFTPAVGQTFYGILNDSTDAISGTFADVTGNLLISNGWEYSVNYAANGDNGSVANDVSFTVITAVPEPSACDMLLCGSLALVLWRSRGRGIR